MCISPNLTHTIYFYKRPMLPACPVYLALLIEIGSYPHINITRSVCTFVRIFLNIEEYVNIESWICQFASRSDWGNQPLLALITTNKGGMRA